MQDPELLQEGLGLMALGMGFVFVFLVVRNKVDQSRINAYHCSKEENTINTVAQNL